MRGWYSAIMKIVKLENYLKKKKNRNMQRSSLGRKEDMHRSEGADKPGIYVKVIL